MSTVIEEYAQVTSAELIAGIVRLLSVDSGVRMTAYSLPSSRRLGLQEQFSDLTKAWKTETRLTSSITEMCMHPAYQSIIGMGPNALPLIFRELEREPDHWFWALKAITGADPVVPENIGRLDAMTRDWLRWARVNGYC